MQYLPQRPAGHVQDLGGVDAEMGAAPEQGAGRGGIRHAPRQGDDRRQLADETDDNLAMSVYLRFLANGTPIQVDTTSAEAKAAIERGKELSQRKVGQLNMACTDCHGKVANHWIRGQWLGEPKGQYDHFPTWRTSLLKVWDIRQRFQWCQVNIRADELPPDAKEYGDLELYLRRRTKV